MITLKAGPGDAERPQADRGGFAGPLPEWPLLRIRGILWFWRGQEGDLEIVTPRQGRGRSGARCEGCWFCPGARGVGSWSPPATLTTMPSTGLGGCCTSLWRLFTWRKRISCRPHYEREEHFFTASVFILDKKQQKKFNYIFLPDSPDSSQRSPLCSLDPGNKHHDEMMHTTMLPWWCLFNP